MRTKSLLALARPRGLLSPAQQTADSIVAKYIARSGGAADIHAVTSLRRIGKFFGGGGFEARILYESTARQQSARGIRLRRHGRHHRLRRHQGVEGRAAGRGARTSSRSARMSSRGLSKTRSSTIRSSTTQAKGNKVEYLGTDQIEGSDVFKLRLTLASNGDVRTYYIDADAYVPIKYEVKRVIRGAEREFEVTLGDYKPVAGWYLPFVLTIGDKGSSACQSRHLQVGVDRSERHPRRRGLRRARGGHVARRRHPLAAAERGAHGAPRRWRRGRAGRGRAAAGEGRFRDHRRTRRAQHRLRRDERPRRRDRRGRRRRPPHRVRRRRERRRLEVHERRHHLQAGLRQADRAVDRRDHHRSDRSEDDLGRHRRGVDPQLRLARRRHLQVHRRRRDAGRTWGSRRPSTS